MATTVLADNAAAVAAGWVRTQWTNPGAGTFTSRYSKYLQGDLGTAGHTVELDGSSPLGGTQAQADTAALTALNAWRANRYGVDTTAQSRGSKKGGGAAALTLDVE
jgi:hypothetical protein